MTLGNRSNWEKPAHQETLIFRPMDSLDQAYIDVLKQKEADIEYQLLMEIELCREAI